MFDEESRFISAANIRKNLFRIQDVVTASGFGLIKSFTHLKLNQFTRADNKSFACTAYERSMTHLSNAIEELFIDFSIITPDGGEIGHKRREIYVDGLIGWNNFLHGRYGWGILVAVYFDGVCESVAIYEPLTNELYTAAFGEGAFIDQHRLRKPDNIFIQPDNYNLGCRALSIAYVAAGKLPSATIKIHDETSWRPALLLITEARMTYKEDNGLITAG